MDNSNRVGQVPEWKNDSECVNIIESLMNMKTSRVAWQSFSTVLKTRVVGFMCCNASSAHIQHPAFNNLSTVHVFTLFGIPNSHAAEVTKFLICAESITLTCFSEILTVLKLRELALSEWKQKSLSCKYLVPDSSATNPKSSHSIAETWELQSNIDKHYTLPKDLKEHE